MWRLMSGSERDVFTYLFGDFNFYAENSSSDSETHKLW
jgi:hypothetical protein